MTGHFHILTKDFLRNVFFPSPDFNPDNSDCQIRNLIASQFPRDPFPFVRLKIFRNQYLPFIFLLSNGHASALFSTEGVNRMYRDNLISVDLRTNKFSVETGKLDANQISNFFFSSLCSSRTKSPTRSRSSGN